MLLVSPMGVCCFCGLPVFCCPFSRVVVLSCWFLSVGVRCFFGLPFIVLQSSFFDSLLVWYAVDVLDVFLAGLSCPDVRPYSCGNSLLCRLCGLSSFV